MPSDDRSASVLNVLKAVGESHQSAVAMTVEEVRTYLAGQRSASDSPATRLQAELGLVGSTHIDLSRFQSLVAEAPPVERASAETIERALATLNELADADTARFAITVEPGGDLRDAVGSALADAGRAFGAARLVDLVRNGGYRPAQHNGFLTAFPFSRWSAAERRLAPPLVVEVDGADLKVGGLHEFLDGRQKLVLVVRGEAPSAPLVRLITPGVFVAQSTDDIHVERLAVWEGPGIVALMPRSAARFVHDPASGKDLATRLTVTELPTAEPKRALGGLTPAQQAEDLRQLKALSALGPAATATAPTASAAAADPAAKLAAWLLQQADLTGVE